MKKVTSLLFVVCILAMPFMVSATAIEKTLPATTQTSIENAIDTASNILFGVLLLAALVFILMAAFGFITAQGDAAKVTKAQNQIIFAVIGIAIAILSKGIIALVQNLIKP